MQTVPRSEPSTAWARELTLDELADLAGLTATQRCELGADPDLAHDLLAHAIATASVKRPAAYALAQFRKRAARPKSTSTSSSAPVAREPEPEPEAGPPDDATVAQVIADPQLRAMLGGAVAAALRAHGRPVPPELRPRR
jgi:hypothetical protein